MYKHTINYVDFNGVERKEDHYFHLSLPEVTRIEASINVDIQEYITRLIADNNLSTLLSFMEKIILDSYGVKSTDGRTFRKSPEARSDFEYSPAYAEFFEQLVTTPGLANEFGEKVADNGQKKNQVTPKVETVPNKPSVVE